MKHASQSGLGSLFLAAGAGALLMYLLDPDQGRRRSAQARDRLARLARRGSGAGTTGARDLGNRAGGLFAQLRSRLREGLGREQVADDLIVERVRAQLGHLVSHPRAIDVSVHDGQVTLRGAVLMREEDSLVRGVEAVRGVRGVQSDLQVYQSEEGVSQLQGGREPAFAQALAESWSAEARLLALAAGGGTAVWGLRHGGFSGLLGSGAGIALALRALTDRPLARLIGSRGREGIDIEKSIVIAAPCEQVFAMWSNYENFPQFMSLVEEVRIIDDRHSHWVVKGPAGTRVEWDAEQTESSRPHRIAWRTEPGAPVQHAGSVQLEEVDGGTRATVRLSYNPPGGMLGHTVATLLGSNPKQELDADLVCMKTFIETGVPARRAAGGASAHGTAGVSAGSAAGGSGAGTSAAGSAAGSAASSATTSIGRPAGSERAQPGPGSGPGPNR